MHHGHPSKGILTLKSKSKLDRNCIKISIAPYPKSYQNKHLMNKFMKTIEILNICLQINDATDEGHILQLCSPFTTKRLIAARRIRVFKPAKLGIGRLSGTIHLAEEHVEKMNAGSRTRSPTGSDKS